MQAKPLKRLGLFRFCGRNSEGARGFTMIELVMVLVLLGIMSVVAVSRFTDTGSFTAISQADQIRSVLRFAQKVAVAQNRAIHVRVDTTAVSACFTQCGAPIASPSATVAIDDGVTLTANPPLPYQMYFDEKGRPYQATDPVGTDASTFTGLVISVSGGGYNGTVTVERETGYVH